MDLLDVDNIAARAGVKSLFEQVRPACHKAAPFIDGQRVNR